MSLSQSAITTAQSTVGTKAEEVVFHLLLQIILILLTTRVVVYLVKKLGQTDVSGEILAGLILGPSVLGALAPKFTQAVFPLSTSVIFVGLAQLALILLMFQIGLEFEFRRNLRDSKGSVAIVSFMGMIVPFTAGFCTAPWFYSFLPEPRPAMLGFQLFFAVAMSITAIPILGRIFMELGLSHTRTAAITIGAAAIDDVAGWLLLGVITLIVQEHFSAPRFLMRIGLLVAYLSLVFLVVRPLLGKMLSRSLKPTGELPMSAIAVVLIVLFSSAAVTSSIGVFAIIGGFVVGVALHDHRTFVEQWKIRVSPLVNTLFLPIFFAYTGLRTDIGTLSGLTQWGICFLVVAVAFVSKFGGAYLGARWAGETNRSALAIGVCMNTRALMELVAINIGYELGVLPRNMFTMLVIMAIASTYVTTPLIRLVLLRQRSPALHPMAFC